MDFPDLILEGLWGSWGGSGGSWGVQGGIWGSWVSSGAIRVGHHGVIYWSSGFMGVINMVIGGIWRDLGGILGAFGGMWGSIEVCKGVTLWNIQGWVGVGRGG